MKYLVVLGDGMADMPISLLKNKTPLKAANKPNMDRLAGLGMVGLVQTVPNGFSPGSDVANLSVIGYPPKDFYTGRSPLEALSMGVNMEKGDIALRCNLVTIKDDIMEDYSAGEISTNEAKELITAIENGLGDDIYKFYAGVSYRHCLLYKGGNFDATFTPPHDISGKNINEYLPKGRLSDDFLRLFNKSNQILSNHPVNLKRTESGKNPATHIWLWGAGEKANLQDFKDRYGLKGGIVSAVDLLKGIAVGANMAAPYVNGATGTLNTNIDGKIDAVIKLFEGGNDYAYLHIEAPDECGHQGDVFGKVKAIELVDYALKRLWDYLDANYDDYVIALLPDHATPLCKKTHTMDAVPYAIYKKSNPANSGLKYDEDEALKGVYLGSGQQIIELMLNKKRML